MTEAATHTALRMLGLDDGASRLDVVEVMMASRAPHIVQREKEYLASGGKLIFPLPEIEIVGD